MNKQAIIQRVAFAELCSCGLHGHIKYPDDTQSYEFLSYDEGVQIITEAIRQKKIMEDEAMVIREEIAGWALFKDRLLSFIRNMMNGLVIEGQPPEMIDKFLEELDRNVSVVFEEYFPDGDMVYIEEISEEKERTLH